MKIIQVIIFFVLGIFGIGWLKKQKAISAISVERADVLRANEGGKRQWQIKVNKQAGECGQFERRSKLYDIVEATKDAPVYIKTYNFDAGVPDRAIIKPVSAMLKKGTSVEVVPSSSFGKTENKVDASYWEIRKSSDPDIQSIQTRYGNQGSLVIKKEDVKIIGESTWCEPLIIN